MALLNAQERALCFPDDALAVIDNQIWTGTSPQKDVTAFFAAVSEALGLEPSCDLTSDTERAMDEVDWEQLPKGIPISCPPGGELRTKGEVQG